MVEIDKDLKPDEKLNANYNEIKLKEKTITSL